MFDACNLTQLHTALNVKCLSVISFDLIFFITILMMSLFLQGDKSGNAIRQHPNPFDEQYTHGKLPY